MIFVNRMYFLRSKIRFEEVLTVLLLLLILYRPCSSGSSKHALRSITVLLMEPVVFEADQDVIRIDMVPDGCQNNDTKFADLSELGFNAMHLEASKKQFYELTLRRDKMVSIERIAAPDNMIQSMDELLFMMFEGEDRLPFCDLSEVYMEFHGVVTLMYKDEFNRDFPSATRDGDLPSSTEILPIPRNISLPTDSSVDVYTPTSTQSTFIRNNTDSGNTPSTFHPTLPTNSSAGVWHTSTPKQPPFLTNSTVDVHTPTTTHSPILTNSTTTKDNNPTTPPYPTHPTVIVHTPTPTPKPKPSPYPTEEYTIPAIKYTTTTTTTTPRPRLYPTGSTLSQGAYLIGIIVSASVVGCVAYVGFIRFYKPRQRGNITNGSTYPCETELQVYPISLVNNHARSESPSAPPPPPPPPTGNWSSSRPPVDNDPPPPYEELLDSGPPPPDYFDVPDYGGVRSGKDYYR